MKKLHLMFFAVVISALAGGCVVSGTMRTHAYVTTPDMVEINSGVYVIQDYDQPVFYSDSYYWRYDGGVWYRSGYYDRGWYRVDVVPTRVRTIDHPYGYVHYRGNGRAVVRDHRDNGWHNGQERREERREVRQDNRVKVRDHRDDRREERKEERHDDGRVKVRDHRH